MKKVTCQILCTAFVLLSCQDNTRFKSSVKSKTAPQVEPDPKFEKKKP